MLHVARRKRTIGLLLHLSDQFKLADREIFLDMCSNKEFTVDDFVAARGRQGVPVLFTYKTPLSKNLSV